MLNSNTMAAASGKEQPGTRGHSEAQAKDGLLYTNAVVHSQADCHKTFQVFTDFLAMPRYLPGLESSQVLSQKEQTYVVTQKGHAQFGIFSKTYQSTREIILNAPYRIDSQSVSTDEIQFHSVAIFKPQSSLQSCQVTYTATIHLPDWAPAFVASSFAKSMTSTQLNAMIKEVHRRHPQSIELNEVTKTLPLQTIGAEADRAPDDSTPKTP